MRPFAQNFFFFYFLQNPPEDVVLGTGSSHSAIPGIGPTETFLHAFWAAIKRREVWHGENSEPREKTGDDLLARHDDRALILDGRGNPIPNSWAIGAETRREQKRVEHVLAEKNFGLQ
jgi:hypothetical protein